jgi:hypothetical protein
MWEGNEVKLTPSLTYLYREGDITARGRWFGENITWSFELIYLGEDIIWQHSTYNRIEEVTPKPLSKVPIRIILKYFKKTKQIPELLDISRKLSDCALN